MQQTISSARAQEMPPKFPRGRIRESLEDANWSECRGRSGGGGRRGGDDDGNNGGGDAERSERQLMQMGRRRWLRRIGGKKQRRRSADERLSATALVHDGLDVRSGGVAEPGKRGQPPGVKNFGNAANAAPPMRARQGKFWPRSQFAKTGKG